EAAHRAVLERLPALSVRPSMRTAPILVLALIPLFANWSWANRNYDYSARDWAYNLLMSVDPYGVLFTNGDNDTFPLWYLQEVEGLRRDVQVIVMSYLNTPWYAQQIRDLTQPCPPGVSAGQDPTRIICQRPYEQDRGPEFYRGVQTGGDTAGVSVAGRPTGGVPTQSILPLTNEEIREVANTPPYLTREAQVYRAGGIEALLPANTVMVPADIFLAYIIQASLGDRPIYFAMTTQAYEELNLRPYLVRQGVALKLNDGPVQPDSARGIYAVPPSGLTGIIGPYIDMPRTETLVSDVFLHRGGIPDEWGHWVDIATEGIPAYYGYTHRGLALVYDAQGQATDAQRHLLLSDKWIELANKRYLSELGQ
ncbi:MAG TPA: hypothetical protein VK933_02075, partial [Longimicrobiales bacterium]|nr:hypothetical protein [Longimicrobiales bacterium]